jgi:hypothetical protein
VGETVGSVGSGETSLGNKKTKLKIIASKPATAKAIAAAFPPVLLSIFMRATTITANAATSAARRVAIPVSIIYLPST